MHTAINLTYGLPLDDDAEHAEKLDGVDATALAQFAKEFFNAKRQVRLIVQPEG
jgi:predicted Zn-dependent peptidase